MHGWSVDDFIMIKLFACVDLSYRRPKVHHTFHTLANSSNHKEAIQYKKSFLLTKISYH